MEKFIINIDKTNKQLLKYLLSNREKRDINTNITVCKGWLVCCSHVGMHMVKDTQTLPEGKYRCATWTDALTLTLVDEVEYSVESMVSQTIEKGGLLVAEGAYRPILLAKLGKKGYFFDYKWFDKATAPGKKVSVYIFTPECIGSFPTLKVKGDIKGKEFISVLAPLKP